MLTLMNKNFTRKRVVVTCDYIYHHSPPPSHVVLKFYRVYPYRPIMIYYINIEESL